MNSLLVFGMIVSTIMILFGFFFKKSKLVGCAQLLWIFLLMGLNTGGGDYVGNAALFRQSNFEITNLFNGDLYGVFCSIFRDNGLDYVCANAVFSLISILVINYIVGKYTKNKNMVFSLFMIFPMFDFIMQKRAFMAVPFDLLAMDFLFSSNKKGRYLYASLTTFVAALIHNSSYFFLLVILLYYLHEKINNDKKFNKLVIVLIVLGFLGLSFIPNYVAQLFGSARTELYFSEGTISITSAIAWMAIHVFFVLLQKNLAKNSKVELSEKELRYEKFVSELNMISLILIPLYLYESAFFRLFKVILIMNYISVANRANKTADKKISPGVLLYVGYVIFIFLLLYVWTGYGFDVLVEPLFENNVFINSVAGVVI